MEEAGISSLDVPSFLECFFCLFYFFIHSVPCNFVVI
jgi:hypothetical protein